MLMRDLVVLPMIESFKNGWLHAYLPSSPSRIFELAFSPKLYR